MPQKTVLPSLPNSFFRSRELAAHMLSCNTRIAEGLIDTLFNSSEKRRALAKVVIRLTFVCGG